MNVIYILLIFSGTGGYEYMCTKICMFNFQSQVPMDQINFFKLKFSICHYYKQGVHRFFRLNYSDSFCLFSVLVVFFFTGLKQQWCKTDETQQMNVIFVNDTTRQISADMSVHPQH